MKKENWLRLSYWLGAIFDFIIAFAALVPKAMGVSSFVHPMGTFSAVAFSWGVLLLFALKKPIERRWVLIPTIIVVFLGLIAGVYSTLKKLRPVEMLIPDLIVGLICIGIWSYSYTISSPK